MESECGASRLLLLEMTQNIQLRCGQMQVTFCRIRLFSNVAGEIHSDFLILRCIGRQTRVRKWGQEGGREGWIALPWVCYLNEKALVSSIVWPSQLCSLRTLVGLPSLTTTKWCKRQDHQRKLAVLPATSFYNIPEFGTSQNTSFLHYALITLLTNMDKTEKDTQP